MLVNRTTDVTHKLWMYRILTSVADTPELSTLIRFKGGTCAAMRNLINRFSVDLDFDLIDETKQSQVQTHLQNIFVDLGLTIKEFSTPARMRAPGKWCCAPRNAPQYFLKYPTRVEAGRNTIKLEVSFPVPKSNTYEPVRLIEIDRVMHCQSIDTLVANKLVALTDRYKKHGSIAGRDIFDIHSFLSQSLPINVAVITERTGKDLKSYLAELTTFIKKHISQRSIDEDLNVLLPTDQFQKLRKNLKEETLLLIGQIGV